MTPTPSDDPTPAEQPAGSPRRTITVEPFLILAILVGWIILQIWVLPKMGVRT